MSIMLELTSCGLQSDCSRDSVLQVGLLEPEEWFTGPNYGMISPFKGLSYPCT